MKRIVTLAAAMIAISGGSASADTLWDQQPAFDNPNVASYPNLITSGFGGASAIFCVSDVTVPATGWTIESVSTYFSDLSFNPTVTSAVLNIFPKSGALPLATNDPRVAPLGQGTQVVPVDTRGVGGASQQPYMQITATGLNIVLAPGEYWIGLTPTLVSGPFGADLHWGTSPMIGSPSATREYSQTGISPWGEVGPAFSLPAFDLAITVTGTPVPAPHTSALLALSGLAAARRRRR